MCLLDDNPAGSLFSPTCSLPFPQSPEHPLALLALFHKLKSALEPCSEFIEQSVCFPSPKGFLIPLCLLPPYYSHSAHALWWFEWEMASGGLPFQYLVPNWYCFLGRFGEVQGARGSCHWEGALRLQFHPTSHVISLVRDVRPPALVSMRANCCHVSPPGWMDSYPSRTLSQTKHSSLNCLDSLSTS